METHKTLGIMLTIIFIMLTVWFIFRKMQMKNIEFVIITLVMVFSSILLGYTSHIGGKMVYEEGAGIIPMEKQRCSK